MKCPRCIEGKIFGIGCPGFKPIEMTCNICNGTAEITEEQSEWIKRGAELRATRRTADVGPTEGARILGIPMSELCAMENGRKKPEEKFFEVFQTIGDKHDHRRDTTDSSIGSNPDNYM